MANEIRLLPALIVLSACTLGFRAIDIVATAAEAAEPAKEEHKDEHGEDTASDANMDEYFADYDEFVNDSNSGEEETPQPETCVAEVDFTSETGLSQYEIQVLRSLSERREELEQRENDIDTREQMAAAAEVRLEDQIAELKALEAGVQDLLAAMEAKRDERLAALVKVYETMKPKDAARIFNTLDNDVLLKVSQRMKSASLAAVMASMSSERAEELTRMLAARADLPDSAEDVMKKATAG